MKSSLITSTVYLNDQVIDDVNNLDPYTVYVNPFYVVTGFMGGDRVSKHYYMNQQRVATDISINYDPNGNGGAEAQGASPRANAQNLALVDLSKVLRALEQPELDTTALTLPRMESVYPELQPSSTTSTALTENITNRILFWYHPDYLGNVDLVTEKDGYAYEFFVYTPWGEEMHQWNANTFNFSSPYRFNGKELDPETGLAYYGARYYQNKIAVWLSVDPFADKNDIESPYVFTHNNPMIYVDPDGRDGIITIKGGQINITSNVYLYGAGATKSVAAQYQRDIDAKWGGTFSARTSDGKQSFVVNVCVTVGLYEGIEKNNPFIVEESWNPNNRDNFIEVGAGDERSYVIRGDEGEWRSQGRIGLTLAQDDPAPHEVGHLLGLGDRYTDENGPDLGWENNIMGNSQNGIVEQRNIDGILKDAMKAYEVWLKDGDNTGKEFRYEINDSILNNENNIE